MNPSATIDPQSSELSTAVTQPWKCFLETYEPLRPALYRFCRYLSRSPWDAEDLCAAFNARDLDRLTALLLDHTTVEVVGASTIYGATSARGTVLTGMLFGSKRMAAPADGGRGDGMDPRFAQGVLPQPARLELRFHRGEPLLLSWYAHRDGEFVRAVSLVELSPDGERIARLRNYFYTPEVIVELCGELDLPCRTNGTFRARGDA